MRGEDAGAAQESLYGFDFDESGLLPVLEVERPARAPQPPPRSEGSSSPRHRPAVHAGRRAREGHGADQVRRRHHAAAHAALQAAAREDRARADRLDRRLGALAHARRRRDRHRRGPADPLRHPPGVAGRARAVHRPGPLRRRPGGGGRRGRRGRGLRRARRHRGRVRAAAADRHRSRRASPRRRRRPIHDYGDPATSTSSSRWSSATSRPASRAPTAIYDDLFFYEGTTHLPIEQHASVADFGPDGKLTLWSSTQTPHYVHRALAKVLEHAGGHDPRHRDAQRRRLRRQVATRSTTRSSSRSSRA